MRLTVAIVELPHRDDLNSDNERFALNYTG